MNDLSRLVLEELPLGDRRLSQFVRVPWRLHAGDPHWTPPLNAELLGSRLLGLTGLLTPAHPYHRHAEVTHFLARRGRQPVGRVSAAVNHRYNEHYGTRLGFFGFFECAQDGEAARALLEAAGAWLARRGMTAMRGPGGYSNATHEPHQAVLIEGFDTPPTVELTYNPPYYGPLLEDCGLAKVKDYHAYWVTPDEAARRRVEKLAARVLAKRSVETRPLDRTCLGDEVAHIVEVYNEAWSANWGFLPLTEPEADAMAASLRFIADPEIIRFAYVDGEIAAVLGALPDPNVALRPRGARLLDTDVARVARLMALRRRIRVLRLMFFGIRPRYRRMGVDAVLFHDIYASAARRGYTGGEASMLLENNDMILRASEIMGGHRYKTWRIYETQL